MMDQKKKSGRRERPFKTVRKPDFQRAAGSIHKPDFHRAPKPEPRPETATFAKFYFEKTGSNLPGYLDELKIKQSSLSSFWKVHALPGNVPEIIASPRGRNYRTTSKRKVIWARGQLEFSMGYHDQTKKEALPPDGSALEAELHGRIYALALEILRKTHYLPLAKVLNFFIVRGGYDTAAVILNVFRLSGDIVRKAKAFAEELSKTEPKTISVSLYFDETRSEYYFESFRPHAPVCFKRLSGTSLLDLALPDRPKLLYPLSVFSQVNESILPVFTDTALELLSLTEHTRFIDLYCGYGLFGLYAAAHAERVIGIDFEGPSIKAARANAEHLYPGKDIRFEAASVTPESLEELLPPPSRNEVILLDPPRSGTSDGVIAAIAARRPEKVLAIYCGIEQMAKECRLWLANGFELADTRCFDMFPGSPNLETMLLLKRSGRKEY